MFDDDRHEASKVDELFTYKLVIIFVVLRTHDETRVPFHQYSAYSTDLQMSYLPSKWRTSTASLVCVGTSCMYFFG